ncbi:hypothetical protein CDL15_Pgr016547 [Punica granatum]|uniref:Uncharacterized protein n=1 Tax=Punica granatum TaxID=22663 RepID=A0A218WJD3_PUNGR|nr:hypothetical protein CDL15_Pgr016547 [Punica granatum]
MKAQGPFQSSFRVKGLLGVPRRYERKVGRATRLGSQPLYPQGGNTSKLERGPLRIELVGPRDVKPLRFLAYQPLNPMWDGDDLRLDPWGFIPRALEGPRPRIFKVTFGSLE